jgi:hypothetical protein
MFNNNWFKTSLLFLGMIVLGLIASLFLNEDTLLVKENSTNQKASAYCVEANPPC